MYFISNLHIDTEVFKELTLLNEKIQGVFRFENFYY